MARMVLWHDMKQLTNTRMESTVEVIEEKSFYFDRELSSLKVRYV